MMKQAVDELFQLRAAKKHGFLLNNGTLYLAVYDQENKANKHLCAIEVNSNDIIPIDTLFEPHLTAFPSDKRA